MKCTNTGSNHIKGIHWPRICVLIMTGPVTYVTNGIQYFAPLSYFSFQPVLHDWCNKGRGMCYPVSGMVHIKEPLL